MTLRVARHTNDLEKLETFYNAILEYKINVFLFDKKLANFVIPTKEESSQVTHIAEIPPSSE
jgi:hypothetical protein